MTEPIYIAQTAEREHQLDPTAWLRKCAKEAREKGCTHFRATMNPEGCGFGWMLLMEGWETRPKDEGPPRWQLRPATPEEIDKRGGA